MKRLLVLFQLIAACLVFDGSAVVSASDPRALQLTYEPWTKICFGGSNCFVATGVRGTCYPSGGGASIGELDGKRRILSAYFSTRQMLAGGSNVLIDQDEMILIPHAECRGLGCSGKFEIDGEFIERLKRARTVTIEATTAVNQKLRLSFSLAGFAQAYDGAGTEPKVFEESQNDLKERLREQADKTQPLPPCED